MSASGKPASRKRFATAFAAVACADGVRGIDLDQFLIDVVRELLFGAQCACCVCAASTAGMASVAAAATKRIELTR